MIWTGVTASAETETSDVQDTVQAIDAVAGAVRIDAVDVTTADVTVEAGGASVDLSGDPADGIAIESPTGTDFEIGLPFAGQADNAVVVDGAVVYDNNNGSTTTPLVHEDGSVQIVTTIADPSAPSEYAYDFPEGTVLSLSSDGSVTISRSDNGVEALNSIAAPWALDARSQPVPTHYVIRGSELIQVVDHAAGTFAYPVVADPTISTGWWYYMHFNLAETKTVAGMSTAAGSMTAMCALAGAPLGPVGAAALGVACAVQGFSIVYTAGVATNSTPRKCLVLKWRPLSGGSVYAETYRDSRCK